MRRILSQTELQEILQSLLLSEEQQLAAAIAGAARELMDTHGLDRAVLLCGEPLRRIGALSAKALGAPLALACEDANLDLSRGLIVDMLFAAKDDGRRRGWIRAVKESGCPVLSVGVPAGVDPDTGRAADLSVYAQITLAPFGYLAGAFLQDGLDHCGHIRPIGGESTEAEGVYRFEGSDAARLLPPRKRTAHKGDSGKALLCVGSSKYVGAALLSARACLAAGCGILFVACPDQVRSALWRLPEAIGVPVGADWNKETSQAAIRAMADMKAVGLGCGVGSGDVSSLIEAALRSKLPLVLDADGLNCLSRHRSLFSLLHDRVVLTPHPGEMSRLVQTPIDQVRRDPIAVAQKYAALWGCTVLLKGAATVVSDGKRTCLVAEGNAGLGKGGSGDVLTGIITGLLSQGIETYPAACLGSYLLGTSAEKAFGLLKERMLRASNVIEALEIWND